MKYALLLILLVPIPARAQSLWVALRGGTTGPGIEVASRLGERWEVRVAGSYFPLRTDRSLNRGGLPLNLKGSLTAGAASVSVDYLITPLIRVSGGLWSFFGSGTARVEPLVASLAGSVLEAEELGMVSVSVSMPERPSPYVGISLWGGLGRFSPGLDLGLLYTGSPRFSTVAEGLLDASAAWEGELNRAFRSARWYPVATVGIRFRVDAPSF